MEVKISFKYCSIWSGKTLTLLSTICCQTLEFNCVLFCLIVALKVEGGKGVTLIFNFLVLQPCNRWGSWSSLLLTKVKLKAIRAETYMVCLSKILVFGKVLQIGFLLLSVLKRICNLWHLMMHFSQKSWCQMFLIIYTVKKAALVNCLKIQKDFWCRFTNPTVGLSRRHNQNQSLLHS